MPSRDFIQKFPRSAAGLHPFQAASISSGSLTPFNGGFALTKAVRGTFLTKKRKVNQLQGSLAEFWDPEVLRSFLQALTWTGEDDDNRCLDQRNLVGKDPLSSEIGMLRKNLTERSKFPWFKRTAIWKIRFEDQRLVKSTVKNFRTTPLYS